MAARDEFLRAFPRVAQIVGAQQSSLSGSVQDLYQAGQELQCEASTLTGPFACMHNEHNQIMQNQATIARKIDDLQSRLQQTETDILTKISNLQDTANGIQQLLAAHFKAA